MDKVEEFKIALKEERYNDCVEYLKYTYRKHGSSFRKAVLNQELFMTPISYKYTDELQSKLEEVFVLAIKDAEDNAMEEYKCNLLEMGSIYEILHGNFSHTMKAVEQNELFKNTYQDQIRMICIFIQDQLRLHNEEIKKKRTPVSIDIEGYVASETSEFNPGIKLSLNGVAEALIEVVDSALPYILYVKNNTIEGIQNSNEVADLCYTYVPQFELMIRALNQSILYKEYWEKFKYGSWDLEIVEAEDTHIDVFASRPSNFNKAKMHFIAGVRRSFDAANVEKKYIYEYKKEFLLGQQAIEKVALNIQVDDIRTIYQIGKTDYKKAVLFYKWIYLSHGELIHSFYLQQKINQIAVQDIIKGHEFLTVLSQIYNSAVNRVFNENERNTYQYLAPIVCIDDIISLFSRLYDISNNVAEKIIHCYIYNNPPGTKRDIFTYPLIYLGNNNIILSSYLISQLNMPRFLENVCLDNKVKIAPIGIMFEEALRKQLDMVDNIKVNTNKLAFASSQGDVEYDFLAMFDEYLIIMEFKAVVTPYEEKRLKNNERIIKAAVKQVNRRCQIINTDWEKIKDRVNIELPDRPVPEEKIIKIMCTNIYDFSTLEYDGVIVTDESLIYKYFKDPYLREKRNGETYIEKVLWKKGKPSPDEFISYLKNPNTITMIDECVDLQGKTFPMIVDETGMGIAEFYLKKNPYTEWMEKHEKCH